MFLEEYEGDFPVRLYFFFFERGYGGNECSYAVSGCRVCTKFPR